MHMLQLWHDEATQISVFAEVVSTVPVAPSGAEAEAAGIVGEDDKTAETPRPDTEELPSDDSKRDTRASYRTGQNEKDSLFRESERRVRVCRSNERREGLAPSLTLAA